MAEEEEEEEEEEEADKLVVYKQILALLQPGETVVMVRRRCGYLCVEFVVGNEVI